MKEAKASVRDIQRILEEDLCYRDKSQVFLALDLLEYHYFIGTEFRGKGCEILLTTVRKKKKRSVRVAQTMGPSAHAL